MREGMVALVAKAIADAEGEQRRPHYYDLAKAAIAEMREPTEAMLNARWKVVGKSPKDEWEAMIDGALADWPD